MFFWGENEAVLRAETNLGPFFVRDLHSELSMGQCFCLTACLCPGKRAKWTGSSRISPNSLREVHRGDSALLEGPDYKRVQKGPF